MSVIPTQRWHAANRRNSHGVWEIMNSTVGSDPNFLDISWLKRKLEERKKNDTRNLRFAWKTKLMKRHELICNPIGDWILS